MELTDFRTGDRVALHPASDWWMRGIRFGIVTTVGRRVLHVLSDGGKRIRLAPRNVTEILERARPAGS